MTIGDHPLQSAPAEPTAWAEPTASAGSTPWAEQPPAPPVPAEITWTRRIWVAAGLGGVAMWLVVLAVQGPTMMNEVMAGATALMAAVTVPAAIVLPRGARWARIVLMVATAAALAALIKAARLEVWPAVAVNASVLVTRFLLRSANARAFFAAHEARR